jgi:hypothetical protein
MGSMEFRSGREAVRHGPHGMNPKIRAFVLLRTNSCSDAKCSLLSRSAPRVGNLQNSLRGEQLDREPPSIDRITPINPWLPESMEFWGVRTVPHPCDYIVRNAP